ncbi:DUF3131 domain-containing protein [Maridesulfovibrio ferrireducens]|uniref:DUF3131 domain-containing protein n=1 Tax=Maridesulfovibrio ferrireducens TaxID=246191 RepID=UPI001A19120D|nr:DUF3131 domain-containing protein [Maridesulfovibrio ferrireducens]MBI9113073.1 DUF3131 domain-containing protein [Maridesulfovibrio ferrireducens]
MSFKGELMEMRSQIAVILGLITTGIIIFLLTDLSYLQTERIVTGTNSEGKAVPAITFTADIPLAAHRNLTADELKTAKTAWTYFENNWNPETGLADSVSGFHFTTLWDTASYLLGLISAHKLEIISDNTFHSRMTKALDSLATIPLYNGELPNKAYDTKSLSMTDYQNQPSETGTGWSAIDIGRLFVPFNVIIYEYSQYTPKVRKIISRWNFSRMFIKGQLFGVTYKNGIEQLNQEGRLGYEEYVSKSFALLGFDISEAYNYLDHTGFVEIEGVKVPVDIRSSARFGAHTYALSEPYILDGLEFGWDYFSNEFSYRIYLAQEKRWENTGILTAVTETALNEDPYFTYNTVFGEGKPWACLTSEGLESAKWRTVSTKAIFGWNSLYDTAYTKMLLEKTLQLTTDKNGFYAGTYENDGRINSVNTCNTNGVILEALCYRKFGPFLRIQGKGNKK